MAKYGWKEYKTGVKKVTDKPVKVYIKHKNKWIYRTVWFKNNYGMYIVYDNRKYLVQYAINVPNATAVTLTR